MMELDKDVLVKVGIGAAVVGVVAVIAKILYDRSHRYVDIPENQKVDLEYALEEEEEPSNHEEGHRVSLSSVKPPLEKLAYEKIAASYMEEQPGQDRFGVPFQEDAEDEEEEIVASEPEDVGIDNGRFEHGPGIERPEGYEARVGTYFVTSKVLAGFNDDLFDVEAKDFIGEEAASVLEDMKTRSDTAYYVVDRDRELWYEILINRLDTYEEGFLEWIQSNRGKGK